MSAQRRMWGARLRKAEGATEERRSYVNQE
jgi:hypothetical protein